MLRYRRYPVPETAPLLGWIYRSFMFIPSFRVSILFSPCLFHLFWGNGHRDRPFCFLVRLFISCVVRVRRFILNIFVTKGGPALMVSFKHWHSIPCSLKFISTEARYHQDLTHWLKSRSQTQKYIVRKKKENGGKKQKCQCQCQPIDSPPRGVIHL